MQTFKVKFVGRNFKNSSSKEQLCIYCRVSVDGKRNKTDIATGIKASTEIWDGEKIVGKEVSGTMRNHTLGMIENQLWSIFLDYQQRGEEITADIIRETYKAKTKQNKLLLPYYTDFVERYKANQKIEPSTLRSYRTRFRAFCNFLEFKKMDNAMLKDVTLSFCKDFKEYLKHEKGYAVSFTNKCLNQLGMVLDRAIDQELILKNPIRKVQKDKYKRPEVASLTIDQIEKIKKAPCGVEVLRITRDCFLLQIYTGMSYCDLNSFEYSSDVIEVDGVEVIQKKRGKTNAEFTVPLSKEAKVLLGKYNNAMPVFTNAAYNRYLKCLAELVGIDDVNLTTHVGRKTFGNFLLNKNFPLEYVQVMMGHTSKKTTELFYARLNKESIVREFAKQFSL